MEGKRSRMGRPPKVPGEVPTRERILDAAIGLFAEQGYELTTVRQLAAATGLTESALYRHFPGKEAILEEILALVEREVSRPIGLDLGVGACERGSVFRELLFGLAALWASEPLLVKASRILYTEAPRNERVRAFLREAYEEKADGATAAIFADCVAKGRLSVDDVRGLARVFNYFRYQLCYQVSILDRGAPLDLGRLHRELEGPIALFESLAEPRLPPS